MRSSYGFNSLVKDSILSFPLFVKNSKAFKKNKSGGETAGLPVFINSVLETISGNYFCSSESQAPFTLPHNSVV